MNRLWMLALLGGCVAHAPLPFAAETAHLRVTLTVPKTGPVAVQLVVPASRVPNEPLEALFAGVPQSFLTRAIRPWPRLETPRGSDLVVSYTVDVPKDVDEPGYPVLIGSFDSPKGRQLALGTLIPQLLLTRRNGKVIDPVPAVIDIQAEADVVCSLPGGGGRFWANDMQALFSALCLVGPSNVVQGSHGLRIASVDFDTATLERLAALEQRAAASLEASHGPRGRLDLVLVHAEPAKHPNLFLTGFNRVPTIALFSPVVPDGRATGAGANILLHELVHSYQPPDKALPHWITEGFTEYFAHRLGLQLDGLPDEALYEGLEGLWSAFKRSAPKGRASEDLLGDYFGGAVLGYCIDVRLRRDGSSLERVLASTRAKSKGDVANAQWEQEIALASAPAGALVLNAKSQPIDPVEGCFREAGLVPITGRNAVHDGYLARALLIESLDAQPRHYDVTVMKVKPGSKLEKEDAILSVNGVRVYTVEGLLERLAVVLRDRPKGVAFEVSRNGRVEAVVMDLPEATAYESGVSQRRVWGKK